MADGLTRGAVWREELDQHGADAHRQLVQHLHHPETETPSRERKHHPENETPSTERYCRSILYGDHLIQHLASRAEWLGGSQSRSRPSSQ